MLYSIAELIKDRKKPLCIKKETKVREALSLMMEHDYSQLPIVDNFGELTGIITEQSIVNTYFNVGEKSSLLDMTVDHCQATPTKISPDANVFEALDQLKNNYAVVVVENHIPIGIVTDYDITQFFRNYSDEMIRVQDVEVTLRQYIETILDTEPKMKAALYRAFGPDKKDPDSLARDYDNLTLWETVQLMTTDENWDRFEPFFTSKDIFLSHMEKVRDVRNKLMHFRGETTNLQKRQLKQAMDWLSARPKTTSGIGRVEISDTLLQHSTTHVNLSGTKGKYTPLEEWLIDEIGDNKIIRMKFEDIEILLGNQLPDSAHKHRAWWSNDYTHPEAVAWIRAGWLVQSVDLDKKEVTFRYSIQAKYIVFFTDILNIIKKERPGAIQAQRASSQQNWLSIINRGGCIFNWVLPKESFLRVEVYIDTGDRKSNKLIFGLLNKQKDAIEDEIGVKLSWDELAASKASRIYALTPFHITKPPEEHEPAKQWGVEMMLKFMDTFLPRMTSK